MTAALSAGGASWLEYRDKRADDRTAFERAQTVAAAAGRHGLRLLVNDRVEIALAVCAAGVHVGQEDLPADVARRLLGPEAIIGLSVGDLEETAAAASLPVDYIAVGPIYATDTKADAGEPVGVELVAAVKAASSIPVVAIGGIIAANAAEVTAAGADCVAAVSALVDAADVEAATAGLLAAAEAGLATRDK